MKFIIIGKNIDVTPGLREAVESKLGKLERYFTPNTEIHVTLSVQKGHQKIEVTIPVKGGLVRSEQESSDMYVSIDLVEEVIERQPADVQAFLYETASQERFCAELCDALRDAHDSAAILRHLQAHQVFLVPLDEQGHWFRYHHLFSDLLRANPASQLSQPLSRLHLRACRWFSAQGRLDEAVEQALSLIPL